MFVLSSTAERAEESRARVFAFFRAADRVGARKSPRGGLPEISLKRTKISGKDLQGGFARLHREAPLLLIARRCREIFP